jgi:hypothetical protein
VSDDSREWRWVGEDGAQKSVSERELVAELSSEALPNYTLVWRKGWAEWLPAMQVRDLAWALPTGKADALASPREQRDDRPPPAPPVYRYPVLKRRAQNLRSDHPAPPRPTSPAPPAPAVSAPDPSAPSEPTVPKSIPPPRPAAAAIRAEATQREPQAVPSEPPLEPPTPTRSEEPTTGEMAPQDDELVEMDALLDSEPAPEPSAPVARFAYGDELDNAQTQVLRGRMPSTPDAYYAPPHAPPVSEAPPPTEEALEILDASHENDAHELPRLPPPPFSPEDMARHTARSRLPLYAMAGTTAIALALFLGLRSRDADAPTGIPLPVTPSEMSPVTPSPPASDLVRCGLRKPAVRLAPSAHPGTEPSFAEVPGSSRLAVGFGDGKEALGITIDPRSLDHDQVFRHAKGKEVLAVVPTTAGGRLAFQVNRRGDALSPATFVDAAAPFALGQHGADLGRQPVGTPGEEPTVLWRDVGDVITTPRTTTVTGTGHAIALRAGGQSGTIRIGWLTAEGAQLSGLGAVQTDAEWVGTPAIAGGDDGALVAFAARRTGEPYWGLQTAKVPRGSAPTRARNFNIPEGGPGENAISPLLYGMPTGRWLLAWTEGPAGNRALRLQVLDAEGAGVGVAERLSPEGRNAGQGALWLRGEEGVAVFFVEAGKQHELWGASIQCHTASKPSR